MFRGLNSGAGGWEAGTQCEGAPVSMGNPQVLPAPRLGLSEGGCGGHGEDKVLGLGTVETELAGSTWARGEAGTYGFGRSRLAAPGTEVVNL